MLLSEILKGIEFNTDSDGTIDIDDIVYDSRKAEQGTIFVCLCGARFDGHEYAQKAYDAGCRCFSGLKF